jgi:hypothetical protein
MIASLLVYEGFCRRETEANLPRPRLPRDEETDR